MMEEDKRTEEDMRTEEEKEHRKARHAEYMTRRRKALELKCDDLNAVPSLQVDEEGFTVGPPRLYTLRRKNLQEVERKVCFLLMWNHSAGNVTLSCQYAGCLRADFEKWKAEDKLFVTKLGEAQLEVADRAQFRLAQRIGLVRMPASVSVHDSALFSYVKRFCPGMGMEDASLPTVPAGQVDGTQEPRSNIPRPTR